MFFFFYSDIENKAKVINDIILDHLIKTYKGNLPFIVRKTDMNLMLEKGFWFYGENGKIAISFWRGMDWVLKIPNISFVVDINTSKCGLVISTTDDEEKTKKIVEHFVEELNLKKEDEFSFSSDILESTDYIRNLDYFIKEYKPKIDKLISKHFTSKSTEIKNSIGKIKVEEFNKELSYISKYQKRIYDGSLPVTLNQIDIDKLGVLEDIHIHNLPSNCQWIFVVGENGTGKSTFLRALTYAICNGPKEGTDYKNSVININVAITIDKYGKKPRHRVTKLGVKESKINSLGFVAFGPTRLNVQKQMFSTTSKNLSNDALNDIVNLKNPFRPLFHTITTLIDLGFLMRFMKSKQKNGFSEIHGLPDFDVKLKNIIEALLYTCKDIVDIHVGTSTIYFELGSGKENSVEPRTFSDLSSGYKNLIAMITHLMVQLYIQQPKVNDPAQLVGIVIIDEIELHAHPKMQVEIVANLSKIFPRIQFIVSTHSPIPLLGAKENTIVLRTSKSELEYEIKRLTKLEKELKFLTPNTIITSDIFEFDYLDGMNEEDFENLKMEDYYKDIKKNEEIEQRLKNIDKSIFPDNLFKEEEE
jgi:predicted ATPase